MADTAQKPSGKPPDAGGKAKLLSLSDLDRRTNACKQALQLRAGIISDLGGDQNTTCAQQELAQRSAVLGAMLEDQEARYLRGETIEPAQYCTLVNAQRRTLNDLGLERIARVVSPDLHTAIAKARKASDDQ